MSSPATITPLRRSRLAALLAASSVAVALTLVPVASRAAAPGEGVFTPTGDCALDGCASAQPAVGATLLQNGKVLLVQGGTGAAQVFDPASGAWTKTGSCTACGSSAFGYSLTTLPSGKVLVAGGVANDGSRIQDPLATAYLYDPATGAWTQTGNMTSAHFNQTATLLPDGRVLVAGGCSAAAHGCGPSGDLATNAAEIYDPATGTWKATGAMKAAVALAAATVLTGPGCAASCGKVLVVGGSNNGAPTSFAQLFDPATGTWALTAPMDSARFLHTVTDLPSGKVFAIGRQISQGQEPRGEIYDPNGQQWTYSSAPPHLVGDPATATLLPNGKVLIWSATPELYDPATDSWSDYPGQTARAVHTATLLAPGPESACGTNCGKVLVAGGSGSSSILYTPPPVVTSTSPANGAAAGGQTVTLHGSGFASATGVTFGGVKATSFTLDPTTPDSLMTAVTPAHGGGSADIVVTSPGGSSATGVPAAAYSFQAADPTTTTTVATTTTTLATTTTTAPTTAATVAPSSAPSTTVPAAGAGTAFVPTAAGSTGVAPAAVPAAVPASAAQAPVSFTG